MRWMMALVTTLTLAPALATSANADPYRWCAIYSAGDDSFENCYFLTIEQCRAAVSGVGGFCRPNNFYDGKPVTTPEDQPVRRRPRS